MEQEESLNPSVEETAQSAETEDYETSEPEGEESAPQEAETSEQPVKRKQTPQERIDEVIFRQREAERQRDYWQKQALRGAHPEQPSQPQEPKTYPDLVKPKLEDYGTWEEYEEAKDQYNFQVFERRQEEKTQHQVFVQRRDTWRQRAEQKYPDLEEVFRPDLPVTRDMAEIIMDMGDVGADVAYFLGKNPHVLFRLNQMDPRRAALELGRLESKLTVPPQKTKTNAPSPTSPVGGKEVPQKRLEDMSTEEYRAYREKQLYGR